MTTSVGSPSPSPIPTAVAPANLLELAPELQQFVPRLSEISDGAGRCSPQTSDVCKQLGAEAVAIADEVGDVVAARPDAARFASVVKAADNLKTFGRVAAESCGSRKESADQVCTVAGDLLPVAAGSVSLALAAPLSPQ